MNPSELFQPWRPPRATLPDVVAIKALFQGVATAEQQQLAMDFIIFRVCRKDEEAFCPGEDGRRNTDYALGMRRVALYLKSLEAADIRKFKEDGMPSKQVD